MRKNSFWQVFIEFWQLKLIRGPDIYFKEGAVLKNKEEIYTYFENSITSETMMEVARQIKVKALTVK